MRLVDIDALSHEMYHLAFETDSNMQKWDGGCWIRYRMFEKCRDNAPTIDAVKIVRCKDCEFFSNPDNFRGKCNLRCDYMFTNDFCSYGAERITDETY